MRQDVESSGHRVASGPGAPGFAVSLVLVSTLMFPAVSRAAVFYVDNTSASCSNSGPGTEAQPYCTIGAAQTAHKGPGITIIVKPGVYREQVNVGASGVSGNPFVFEAAPGGPVVVDGSDDFSSPSLWVQYSGEVYLAASVTWNPVQVFAEGERLTRANGSPSSVHEDEFLWVSGEGLYVNVGGDNPGEHPLWVGRRLNGFQVPARSWVTIRGFHVAHTESRGIFLNSGCTDVVVTRDTVTFTGSYGIQSNNGQRHVIEHCSTSDNQLHGIGLIAGTANCTIRYNESMRNADPAIRRANGFYLNAATSNVYYGNRAFENQDSGFNFGDFADNNVCFNNLSWNNGDHGYDHLAAAGTIHFHDVAFGNYKDGFSIEANSPNTHLYNCIAVDNGLTTNEFDLWVNDSSSVGFVSDYNIFWNSTSQQPFKYINTKYATIDGYQAASGQDLHSHQLDPLFVNAPLGDFRLQPGSPAIDAATSGPPGWPSTDMAGNPRVDDPATPNIGAGPVPFADRGAFEYDPPDQPPQVASPDTVTVAEGTPLTVPVTASDADGDPIAFLTALDAPAGAVFTPGPGNTTGSLAWVPPFGSAGYHTVRFVAANALADTDTTVIRVTDVDQPPGLAAPDSASVAENDPLAVGVTVSDPDGDPIDSLTVSGLPAGASFVAAPDHLSATLSWTPGFGQAGSYTVVFVAANAMADSDTTVIVVNDTDRAPVVIVPENATASVGDSVVFAVTALDPDGGPIDSLTAAGLPGDATFTLDTGGGSGTFRWAPALHQVGVHTVWFTATHGLSGTDSTVITVNPPVAGVRVGPPVGPPLQPRLMPNPVRGTAHLRFSIAHDGPLAVRVFDVGGRAVRTLLDDRAALAGEYDVRLEAGGRGDLPLATGLYFYRIETLHGTARGRFMVLR